MSSSSKPKKSAEKVEKLRQFNEMQKELKLHGFVYCQALKDMQETLQGKEFIDTFKTFGPLAAHDGQTAAQDPLAGHQISSQYRTKMTDWMIEVCTSFKCVPRTYFLSVTIMDKYLQSSMHNGIVRGNQDIHMMGVISMYLASKYEDIYPIHSKVVAEKIAHGAMTQQQILQKELEFLSLFNFEMNFTTLYDFHETYSDKIQKQMLHNLVMVDNESDSFLSLSNLLLSHLSSMSLLLLKMAIQCSDFSHYSQSILTISSLYAATAFIKHSPEFAGPQTNKFIDEVRRIIH